MMNALYRPIFNTWIAFIIALMVSLISWIVAASLELGEMFSPDYSGFPSPFFMVLVISVAVGFIAFIWFFLEREGITVLAIIGVTVGIYVVIILLDWVLTKWGSQMILIAIPVGLGLFTGVQLMLFIRKRVEAGVWITFALIIVFAGLTWWAGYTDWEFLALSVILYYGSIVAICFGYAAVFVVYTIYVRRTLGV
ncbi:MAG: hypothetical protein JSW25_09550 [Thermoplasmata archaeon]|nr:MAG: hypothetical protein JSW25_09550 [Thermoplasmata archaeon]